MSFSWSRTRAALGALAFLFAVAPSERANAADFVPHLELGGSHALTAPQSTEFGFGGRFAAGGEITLGGFFGLEPKVSAMMLGKGDSPTDVRFAPREVGVSIAPGLGLRFYPLNRERRLWLSGDGSVSFTGDLTRLQIGGGLGYDFAIGRARLGPMVGYTQIVEPDSSFRPEDARILTAGIHFAFAPAPPPLLDRDKDGILDRDDACPDVPGIRTNNPKTNGCPKEEPKDRDKDGIIDSEDACPDVPGIKTNDPKTNGCPRPDRDGDRVYDDEDACPDIAGVPSTDPTKNGCPRGDRDKDGVYDDEDACPDIAGVRTEDPKTNGCPPGDDNIRIEGERLILDDVILFDLDSPRVRHASWPVVERIAKYIQKTGEIMEISVEGHADATGTEAYNVKISRMRAEAVVKLLIKYGVPEDRLKAESFGRSKLKVQTNAAERANRRVEFWVTRSRAAGQGTEGSSEKREIK
ncbi:MAG: OmpA family protein [Polyangiaceae bacterium]